MINFFNIKSVGEKIKIFPTLVFIFIALYIKAQDYTVPDFAYPQTVASETKVLLDQSLEKNDQLIALRYLLNFSISTSLEGKENNLKKVINKIDSASTFFDPTYKALAFLLEADLIYQEYSENSYTYDSRKLPSENLFVTNPDEWSGEIFKNKIYNLLDSATLNIENLPHYNIDHIQILLSNFQTASNIGMTVPEFIIFKASSLLKKLSHGQNDITIPFYPEDNSTTIGNKSKNLSFNLLQKIIHKLSLDNSVIKALAYQEISNLISYSEKKEYLVKSLADLKGTEGEGLILYQLWNLHGNDSIFYNDIKDWLQIYPDGFYSDYLKYAESQITQQKIEIRFPKQALPGELIKGELNVSNLNEGYLLIYKLSNQQITNYDEFILKKFNENSKPLIIIPLETQGEIPFKYTKNIEIPALEPGNYIIIPSKTKKISKGKNQLSDSYFSIIRVTDIAILTAFDSNEKESGRAYVVKASNQEPIEGAKVTYYTGDTKKTKGSLITNSEGWVNIPNGYYRLEACYKNNFARREAGFSYFPVNQSTVKKISILTDLSVYKPGDSVKFSVIGFEQGPELSQLITDQEVNITMYDVNFTDIGSVKLKLNHEGRANGELKIPDGRLLGTYQLIASFLDLSNGSGSVSFQVEEFKLPSFFVSIKQDGNNSDSICFSGDAITYSGLPISNSKVVIKISYIPFRWGISSEGATYYTNTVTGPNGNFKITLPLNNLKNTPFKNGRYSIVAEITSQDGETVITRPLYFYLTQKNEIRPEIKEKYELKSDSLKLYIPVYDEAGLPVIEKVNYRFTNKYDSSINFEGEFFSPILKLDSNLFPSGKYSLEFFIDCEEDKVSTETVLWRKEDKTAPFPTPLWIPQNEYIYTPGQNEINIAFGSYWKDWLLCYTSDREKILDVEWLAPDKDLKTLNVKIPSDQNSLFVTICGMHDFTSSTGTISIIPQKSIEKMTVEATSFRNKIIAGENEDWSFKFKIADKLAENVYVFAVMSDKALNYIKDFKWNLNMNSFPIYNKVNINPIYNVDNVSYRIFNNTVNLVSLGSSFIPQWQTYGYPLISSGFQIHPPLLYNTMVSRSMKTAETSDESVIEDEQEEINMETPSTGANFDSSQIEVRPVELSEAFFKTDLKTNQEGIVDLNFVVPNSNTTWQLQIAGYNDELYNASLLLDAIASKPVMVKSNLPQFLRTGDKAILSSTIYNNSDTILNISCKMVISDFSTGKILETNDFTVNSLYPSENRVISILYTIPNNIPCINVSSYAFSGGSSDGEACYIPILPSNTPVLESKNFYIGSEDETLEIKLPKYNKDSNLTLKYCDNPLWEVILSLPSLSEITGTSALEIGRWLYGSIITKNIIDCDDQINKGLKTIFESNDSSLLISNLDKDQSLKITDINASPWINNASSETQRIINLQDYLETEKINNRLELKINELKKLQNPDGGFSWFEGMKSSPFITSEIIKILSYLSQDNLLNESLESLAHKAVNYYDKYLIEHYKNNKGFKTDLFINYFYNRNKFGYQKNKELRNIETECCDTIISQWKYWNPVQKSKAAMVLLNNGINGSDINSIAGSVIQFINKRMPITEEAIIVEFLERINGFERSVEEIYQKILIQKETLSWGYNINYIPVIQLLLNKPEPSNIDKEKPEIYIGEDELILSNSQEITGNYTVTLDPRKVSGHKLTIHRKSGSPAWGGIVNQKLMPIKDIKSVKVTDLSMDKILYLRTDDGQMKRADSFTIGDKVTVNLVINCGKEMDYIVLKDSRSASLEPDNVISGMIYIDGIPAYQEIGSNKTSFFIEHLTPGKHILSYDCHISRAGEYSLGIAEIQSLYSPIQVAHSSGTIIKVDQ